MKGLFHEDYAFTVNDFFRAVKAGDASATTDFLNAGIEVDIDDGDGGRALLKAAKAGEAETLKVLIDKGAEVNYRLPSSRTALILAAGSTSGDAVRHLLEAGADPLIEDSSGWTALSLAAGSGSERAAEMLAPVSKTLVDQALLIAALRGHTGIIDILLMNRANIHVRGSNEYTPLMAAAKEGHEAAVQLLLERDADRFALNTHGHTAAQIAKKAGHDDIAALLAGLPTSSEITGKSEDPLAIVDNQGKVVGTLSESDKRQSIRETFISGAVPRELKMETYRERHMPVVLTSVDQNESQAEMRLLYDTHESITAAPGEEIPGSGLRIVELSHRNTQGKEGLRDASHMIVEDTATGERHQVASGQNARSLGTYALLKISGIDRPFEARRGDEFTMISGQGDGDEFQCRILDVRPDQVLIENLETKDVITIKRQ